MQHLILNGWHLAMEGVGQGAYARRLLAGILRHSTNSQFRLSVMAPHPIPELLQEQHRQVEWITIDMPRLGHALLNALAWNNRLLADRRLRAADTVFFSPGPCWGWSVPPRMAITHHDCIYRHFPVYLGRRGIRKWSMGQTERYLHKAQLVFTEAEHARNDIVALTGLPSDRLKVIPAWLPPEFNQTAAKATAEAVRIQHGLPERYWVYVGGYDIRKNVEFLLHAYAHARARTACPALVLAGRIPTHNAPTHCDVQGALRQHGLSAPAIITPGFIPDADLPGLYAGAELMIYPSLFEGYGLPPLEAMGCGCPALVANNTSLREVVTDHTYRFETNTSDELTDLLARAARQPLPRNPSFAPQQHDERRAVELYLGALEALVTTP